MLIEKQIEVVNKLGLHARAAAKLVQTASKFESEVFIELNGQSINAKSIMGIMMLAASCGTIIGLKVAGEDEELAAQTIIDLFADRFGEGE
ncbi:MAG: phosphocarrier protein HPr [Parasphingorhabdus sp.]|jgi:phosphocarrier protein HPr